MLETVGTLVNSSEKLDRKCLYMGGVTSLGYPLLQMDERLEKHMYNARRRRRPTGLGSIFFLSLENDKLINLRVYPENSGYIQLRNRKALA